MPPGMRRMGNGIPISEARVYRPTWEEFKDFNKFMEKIEADGAGEAGICKIIPPKEWVPRKAGYNLNDMDFVIDRPVLQKFVSFGERGTYQTKAVVKSKMTVGEYYNLSHEPNNLTPHHESHEELERKYWKTALFSAPIYGCDVAAPLSDPDLDVWNISKLGCILDVIKKTQTTTIQGVLSPYLYFGMWKATFSWHIEDLDLYAINLVHQGAPKTWYCVPPKYGHLLERAARVMFPTVARWCSNFMRHKTCLISPQALDKFGVPYQKIVQEEREIIITFPYAYHQGFNHGFNIAESTNFAMPSWIEYGKRSKPCDCVMVRVQFPMDIFVKEFQPEKYEDWIAKRDIAPHPMDPPDVVKKVQLQLENPQEYAKLVANSVGVNKRKLSSNGIKDTTSNTDKKYHCYDVYQHHELSNVLVYYNAETGRIRKGAIRLANFFDKPNVPQLAEKGYLIKIDRIEVLAKKSPSVKPKRIKINNDAEADKNKMLTDESPLPRSKKLEKRDSTKLQRYIKEQVVNLLKLHHVQSGMKIKVFPETYKPAYNVPEELMAIVDINNLESLVHEGVFTIEGEIPTQMKKWAASPIQTPPFISCNLYMTRDTNLPVIVTTESKIVLDAHLPHIKNLMAGTTLKALLDEEKLIHFAKMRLKKRQPFEPMSNDVLVDGYNPADLFQNSDLNFEFVMENDPEDLKDAEEQVSGIESCKIKRRKLTDPNKSISRKATRLKAAKKSFVMKKTKAVVAYLESNHRGDDEDRLFSLKDLANATKLYMKSILPIMDIFEDLRFIQRRNSSELDGDITCIWKGIEKSDLNDTLHSLVQQTEEDQPAKNLKTNCSPIKLVLRQIIKKLLSAKKEETVLLENCSGGITSKLEPNSRIPIALGVLEALGLIKSIPYQPNLAFWDHDGPYQILPEKEEDNSLSTCTTTGNLIGDDGNKAADSEDLKQLDSFEVQEIAQKTKEVVISLMSRFPGEDSSLRSFSLNGLATETSLSLEFVHFILEMLEEIEIIKKDSCDETNSTCFKWIGTENARNKISLLTIGRRSHAKRKLNAKTVLVVLIRKLDSLQEGSGVDIGSLRFNRNDDQTTPFKEFFIVIGILDALGLVHFSDNNMAKWITASHPILLTKHPETVSHGSSSFPPTTCSSESEKSTIPVTLKIPKPRSLMDVVTKTKEIVHFLKDGNYQKFSLANLEENGIREPLLVHHILDILESLQIISEEPVESSSKHYIWRGIKPTSLLVSISSIMLKRFNGQMDMEEVLKVVLKRIQRAKKGHLKNLPKRALASGKQVFRRNVNIVVGVLDGLGLVEHSAGDALNAKWLRKKLCWSYFESNSAS